MVSFQNEFNKKFSFKNNLLNRYDRLKQINRIRNCSKEFYTKQQQQHKSNTNTSANPINNMQSNENSNLSNLKNVSSNTAMNTLSSSNNKGHIIENQLDFTDYI